MRTRRHGSRRRFFGSRLGLHGGRGLGRRCWRHLPGCIIDRRIDATHLGSRIRHRFWKLDILHRLILGLAGNHACVPRELTGRILHVLPVLDPHQRRRGCRFARPGLGDLRSHGRRLAGRRQRGWRHQRLRDGLRRYRILTRTLMAVITERTGSTGGWTTASLVLTESLGDVICELCTHSLLPPVLGLDGGRRLSRPSRRSCGDGRTTPLFSENTGGRWCGCGIGIDGRLHIATAWGLRRLKGVAIGVGVLGFQSGRGERGKAFARNCIFGHTELRL